MTDYIVHFIRDCTNAVGRCAWFHSPLSHGHAKAFHLQFALHPKKTDLTIAEAPLTQRGFHLKLFGHICTLHLHKNTKVI